MTGTVTHPDLWIGGAWVPARSTSVVPVLDPSTEEVLATAALAGTEDVDDAVAAARTAFEDGRGPGCRWPSEWRCCAGWPP